MHQSLCVIPSRYASERLPGKPLLLIKGKTLIQRVWERVVSSHLFDEVVVATDDERIFQHVIELGGKAMMTSKDCRSGTERLIEVSEKMDHFDIYVNVQGDEPLIPSKLLESLLAELQDGQGPLVVTASTRVHVNEIQDPNAVKVVVDAQNRALLFSRAAIPFSRKGEWEIQMHAKHIGLYGFTQQALKAIKEMPATHLEAYESLEQLRWLYHGMPIKVIPTSYVAFGVDVPDDISLVERIIDDQLRGGVH